MPRPAYNFETRYSDPGLDRLRARVVLEIRLNQLPQDEQLALRVKYGIGESKAKDDWIGAQRCGLTVRRYRELVASATHTLTDRPSLPRAA